MFSDQHDLSVSEEFAKDSLLRAELSARSARVEALEDALVEQASNVAELTADVKALRFELQDKQELASDVARLMAQVSMQEGGLVEARLEAWSCQGIMQELQSEIAQYNDGLESRSVDSHWANEALFLQEVQTERAAQSAAYAEGELAAMQELMGEEGAIAREALSRLHSSEAEVAKLRGVIEFTLHGRDSCSSVPHLSAWPAQEANNLFGGSDAYSRIEAGTAASLAGLASRIRGTREQLLQLGSQCRPDGFLANAPSPSAQPLIKKIWLTDDAPDIQVSPQQVTKSGRSYHGADRTPPGGSFPGRKMRTSSSSFYHAQQLEKGWGQELYRGRTQGTMGHSPPGSRSPASLGPWPRVWTSESR